MAMIKIVSPSGWDWDRPVCVPIKISARGLIGNDRSDFLKMASHAFLDAIDNIKVAKDELPIHIIALGSHEFWGPNRNGDTFLEKTCKDRHHTFVKYARWFRNHKNRPDDGDPHYGIIKESAYNDQMHRVELLGLLFQEKSAASRRDRCESPDPLSIGISNKSPGCKLPHGIHLAWACNCALFF